MICASMYKRNYRNFSRGRNPRMGRRIKEFDPTFVVQKSLHEQEVQASEYETKNSFSDFSLNEKLLSNISARGYKTPTPIQDQTIPMLMEGRDLVGLADTGTGKTGAFLIPLIDKAIRYPKERVLIIVPTRELAQQIEEELKVFVGNLNVYSTVCVGGMPIYRQIQALRRSPNFVIGTPGRLMDLSKRGNINFRSFGTVVLDEVDRMLDMGFVKDIEQILKNLPSERQSLFFSATANENTNRIISRFVKEPAMVKMDSQNTLVNIKQEIIRVNGDSKINMLKNMLREESFEKVLVFGRTKRNVEKLSNELIRAGIRSGSIHGNKSQNQRYRALNDFRDGKLQVLVATDVASRGIDVSDITHVINYDLPENREAYIHRIGRTGRAKKTGTALSFV